MYFLAAWCIVGDLVFDCRLVDVDRGLVVVGVFVPLLVLFYYKWLVVVLLVGLWVVRRVDVVYLDYWLVLLVLCLDVALVCY